MSDSVDRRHASETRWIDSGSGGGYLDTRAGYAPAAVIVELQRALRAAGIEVNPNPNMLHTASIAAADLLRALGVRPESAPGPAFD